MRTVAALLLTIAMLATGALVALDLLLVQSETVPGIAGGRGDTTGADRARIVGAFYDAANTVFAGHDSWSLAAVISPGVEVHRSAENAAIGQAALRDYLSGLREQGDLRLSLVRLVDGGEDVAALVEARAPMTNGGSAESGTRLLWRTTDLFRIERGMIAGYWPGATGDALSAALPQAEVPATPGDTGVSLTRIELGPDVAPITLRAPLPHLLLIERGAFAATREVGVHVAFAGNQEFVWFAPAPGDGELMLRPGDVLVMAHGHGPTLRGSAATVSSALSLLVGPEARLFSLVSALPRDLVTVMGMHDPWRLGNRFNWQSGAVTHTLAVEMLPDWGRSASTLSISASPIWIESGENRVVEASPNLRLAIVRSGNLSVSGLSTAGHSTPAPRTQVLSSELQRFSPGDSFPILPGVRAVITNTASSSAEVLQIEIAPAQESNPVPAP